MRNEELKRRKLQEKGITLVALVVTIIILLILAGVTLNLALGEGGIFARAKNTADRYQAAQANELGQLSELEKELDKYGNGGSATGSGDGKTGNTASGGGQVTENTTTGGEGQNDDRPAAETSKSYVGYYADLDGNPETAEGIIYADLAKGSGRRQNME